jgi:hypothetical protein
MALGWNWILFWKIGPDELHKQVDQYENLKITQSYRGISTLLLLFSAALTSLVAMLGILGFDSSAFVDVGAFIFLAFFVYKGARWAIILAMLFWTSERAFLLLVSNTSVAPLPQVLWWTFYMHWFWGALRVENARRKLSSQS